MTPPQPQCKQDSIYINHEYLTRNPTWHVEHSAWKARHVAEIMRDHGLEPQRIAEAGCGAGEVLVQLKRVFPGSELVGYELSPQAFALCRPRASAGLEYRNLDINQVADTYDLVLCLDVFEHVDDYIGFLRALRQKARFKEFHIPIDISVQSVFRGHPLQNIRKSVGHLHHFTADTAIDTLRYCGYEILDTRYTGNAIDFSGRGWKGSLMKYPRKLLFGLSPHLCVRLLGGWSLLVLAR